MVRPRQLASLVACIVQRYLDDARAEGALSNPKDDAAAPRQSVAEVLIALEAANRAPDSSPRPLEAEDLEFQLSRIGAAPDADVFKIPLGIFAPEKTPICGPAIFRLAERGRRQRGLSPGARRQ